MTQQILGLEKRVFKVCPIFILLGPAPTPSPWSTCQIWSNLGPHPIKMIPTKFDWNLPTGSGYDDEIVFSPLGPLPQTLTPSRGPKGVILAFAMNKLYSSYIRVGSTYKILWLYCFWVWRRRFCNVCPLFSFGALPRGTLGPICPIGQLGPRPPKDDPHQVWLPPPPVLVKKMKM